MPVFRHSAIRILSLALLTVLINKQAWTGLLILLLPLAVLFYRFPHAGLQVLQMSSRLRWFFLSILLLYCWYYPGTPLLPWMGDFSPIKEGVDEAALRISSLLLIISYCGFLLLLTPRNELIAGIQYLLSPLKLFGIDSSSFALRLALVLAIVPQLNERRLARVQSMPGKSLSMVVDKASELVREAAEQSVDYEIETIQVPEPVAPGVFDLLVPALLLAWLVYSY